MVVLLTRSPKIMRGFTSAGGQMVPGGICPMRHAAADHGKVARREGEDCKGSDDKLAHVGSHDSPDSKDRRIRKESLVSQLLCVVVQPHKATHSQSGALWYFRNSTFEVLTLTALEAPLRTADCDGTRSGTPDCYSSGDGLRDSDMAQIAGSSDFARDQSGTIRGARPYRSTCRAGGPATHWHSRAPIVIVGDAIRNGTFVS